MHSVTDWDLVEQARSGSSGAFAELVRRYHQGVIHFCYRMLGSLEDAEDLAQESFVRVYRHLGRLEARAKFSTVLFGIARNLALNFIRDVKRRGRDKTEPITRDDESERRIQDPAHRPDEVARIREIGAAVEEALGLLSPEHREVIVLRELQGLDYEAIAGIVGCRNGTVKSRLARAREQLRLRLIEQAGEQL